MWGGERGEEIFVFRCWEGNSTWVQLWGICSLLLSLSGFIIYFTVNSNIIYKMNILLCQCVFVLGGDVGLQVCSCLRCDRSVAGDVQEDQIKSNKVSDEPEQHHRVPPKPVALIQHPEDAPSWSNRAERGNWRLSLCPATLLQSATCQRTHLRSRLFRCKCPRFRLNSLHLCQTASWLRYTSRTPRCRKWAPNLTEQSARIRLIQFGLTSTWTRLTLTHLCTRWRCSAASSRWCQTFYML